MIVLIILLLLLPYNLDHHIHLVAKKSVELIDDVLVRVSRYTQLIVRAFLELGEELLVCHFMVPAFVFVVKLQAFSVSAPD